MPFPPLATTSVGSFPRPAWLAATDRNQLTFRADGAARREAMNDATIVTLSATSSRFAPTARRAARR